MIARTLLDKRIYAERAGRQNVKFRRLFDTSGLVSGSVRSGAQKNLQDIVCARIVRRNDWLC
jgi:hypothetical protein